MASLGKKIEKAVRLPYWIIRSVKTKREFKDGKSTTYRFLDDHFYSDIDEFAKTLEDNKTSQATYWKQLDKFNYKKHFPKRYEQQEKMLLNSFLPLYKEKPTILDVGSAEGEWSAKIAPYCTLVDAYEYSQQMVDMAKKDYGHIENVNFSQGDARTIAFDKQYDGAMLLGVLTYISSDEDALDIIKSIYSAIKMGGYLVIKDTLNKEGIDAIYLYNKRRGYDATYRSQEKYYSLYREAGFTLKQEFLIGDGKNLPLFRYSRGAIWQKTEGGK